MLNDSNWTIHIERSTLKTRWQYITSNKLSQNDSENCFSACVDLSSVPRSSILSNQNRLLRTMGCDGDSCWSISSNNRQTIRPSCFLWRERTIPLAKRIANSDLSAIGETDPEEQTTDSDDILDDVLENFSEAFLEDFLERFRKSWKTLDSFRMFENVLRSFRRV